MDPFVVHSLIGKRVVVRSKAPDRELPGIITAVSDPCWSKDREEAITKSNFLVRLDGGGYTTTSGSQLVLIS